MNGGFTQWTAWTVCTATCNGGFHTRVRACTNPAPSNGGLSCVQQNLGVNSETEACNTNICGSKCFVSFSYQLFDKIIGQGQRNWAFEITRGVIVTSLWNLCIVFSILLTTDYYVEVTRITRSVNCNILVIYQSESNFVFLKVM